MITHAIAQNAYMYIAIQYLELSAKGDKFCKGLHTSHFEAIQSI